MIGIIIPPGEIKKMVEKTAAHVAKNGSEFEKALIEIEQHKPEFSFLLKENPYRAYYDHMVADYSRKLLAENQVTESKQEEASEAKKQDEIVNDEQAEYLEKVFEEVKEPDPDQFTAEIPEKLTRAEMAMIQHTAEYVAVNGKNFLIALSEREKNNPQFEFLRSSSHNHEFFQKTIEAYTNVLSLASAGRSSKQIEKLYRYVANKKHILDNCQQIYEYHRMKQEKSKGSKNENHANNKKENQIDWNDFELVETIVFEDPSASRNRRDVRLPLFAHKNLQETIISSPKKKELLQQCQVCSRNILASEISKHLKTCIGAKSNGKRVMSQGNDVNITDNLQKLSERRPDIFGGDAEKIKLSSQEQEDGKGQRAIWDGHAPNMTRTTASVALLQNEQKKIHGIIKDSKGN